MSQYQLSHARRVASEMNYTLLEIETHELQQEQYVLNQGDACLYCKRELYGTIQAVATKAKEELHRRQQGRKKITKRKEISGNGIMVFLRSMLPKMGSFSKDARANQEDKQDQHDNEISLNDVVLFNGTNRDDLSDLSRLGLHAAAEFQVQSPLAAISKSSVRRLAAVAGLSNAQLASSACLRSRLAYGVRATKQELMGVEKAEDLLRSVLRLRENENIRVRILKSNSNDNQDANNKIETGQLKTDVNKNVSYKESSTRLAVEVDEDMIPITKAVVSSRSVETRLIEIGVMSASTPIEVRQFRSGSLSGFAKIDINSD